VDSSKSLALSLIDLSRTLTAEIVAKVAPQAPLPTDVIGFIDQELKMIKLLTTAGISIRFDENREQLRSAFKLPLGPSETMWLKIIFFNLMTNAIKYGCPRGHGHIEVTLREDSEDRILSVSDQGPGISREERRHLFEPGISRSIQGWPQGTGLGLYESRRLANLLGWKIAAPEQSRGAIFEIRIPQSWRKDYAR
jgi:signal transduction histidine kinase